MYTTHTGLLTKKNKSTIMSITKHGLGREGGCLLFFEERGEGKMWWKWVRENLPMVILVIVVIIILIAIAWPMFRTIPDRGGGGIPFGH